MNESVKARLVAQYGRELGEMFARVLDDEQAGKVLARDETGGKGMKIRLVTEQEAASGVKVKERGKRPIDMSIEESCDAIALHRVRNDPQVGVGIKATELYGVDEVSRLLKAHPATVRRWLGGGQLAGFKTFGGQEWRVKGSVLLRLIDGLD